MNQHQRKRLRKFAALMDADIPTVPRRRKHRVIPIAPRAVDVDISGVWLYRPYGERGYR